MFSASLPRAKVTGIVVLVTGGQQQYLPVGRAATPLASRSMDARDLADWLCAHELRWITQTEFEHLGAALPPHIKGHIMVKLATMGLMSLEASRWSWLAGQRILAEHRRFLGGSSCRTSSF